MPWKGNLSTLGDVQVRCLSSQGDARRRHARPTREAYRGRIPTEENAALLESRLNFVETEILNDWDSLWHPEPQQ